MTVNFKYFKQNVSFKLYWEVKINKYIKQNVVLNRMNKAYILNKYEKNRNTFKIYFKLFLKRCDKIFNNVFQFTDKKHGKRILVLCS